MLDGRVPSLLQGRPFAPCVRRAKDQGRGTSLWSGGTDAERLVQQGPSAEDVRACLGLSLEDAAARLGCRPTALIRACRCAVTLALTYFPHSTPANRAHPCLPVRCNPGINLHLIAHLVTLNPSCLPVRCTPSINLLTVAPPDRAHPRLPVRYWVRADARATMMSSWVCLRMESSKPWPSGEQKRRSHGLSTAWSHQRQNNEISQQDADDVLLRAGHARQRCLNKRGW